jgi:hypothetical protein
MADMYPSDLGGYEGHRTRKGGDLGHVDQSRSGMNRRLIGGEDWAGRVQTEITEMAQRNFVLELEKLEKRRRKAEALKRIAEGPRDPWRKGRHGPLREVILTGNKEWFESARTSEAKAEREHQFERLAIDWLTEHFGDDVVHARADLDEEAYHIHAIIVPRSKTSDGRLMLQPSKHPMIKDYEAAQDNVGEWFSEIGLRRGERRAKKIREAKEHNASIREVGEPEVEVPERRKHVSPREWREQQEARLAEREQSAGKREEALAKRQKDVAVKERQFKGVLDIVRDVISGKVDPTVDEIPSGKSSPAATLFSKAISVLRTRIAQQERANLAREYESIRAADDAIVEVAKLLPAGTRRKIAEARKGLARRIAGPSVALQTKAKGRSNPPRNGGEEKE